MQDDMKRIAFLFLAVSSLCLNADAATRPHYGRTLRVSLLARPTSLEPIQSLAPTAPQLAELIFDTLVSLDQQARPQPQLAISWSAEEGNRRWQINLRPGVMFHDGSPLTPEVVASSLRAANPSWQVSATGDSVQIVTDAPNDTLPAELSLARNAIVRRDSSGKILGTGPFRVNDFQPGRKLTLAANDDYWNARPFLDSIEIEFGISPRDQLIALELGKADLIEIAPEQIRRSTADGRRVVVSRPIDLFALVFTRDRQSVEEGRLRDALSYSLDRASMRSALLQGEGEVAGAILPVWIGGYEFLFPAKQDLARAQQIKSGLKQSSPWSLGYNANDPVARLMADRIVLNAHDAGLAVQVTPNQQTDLRLVRIPLVSLDSRLALRGAALAADIPAPAPGGTTLDQNYQAERSLMESQRIIPLLHLPRAMGIGIVVRNWQRVPDASWDLDSIWLATEKP
jgi:peptide/nickel transport system substrate-binding protein